MKWLTVEWLLFDQSKAQWCFVVNAQIIKRNNVILNTLQGIPSFDIDNQEMVIFDAKKKSDGDTKDLSIVA